MKFVGLRAATVAVCLICSGLTLTTASEKSEIEILIKSNKLDAANKRVRKLLSDSPGNPDWLFLSAVVEEKKGKRANAAKIYQQLIKDHPGLIEPYNNLAIHHATNGDFKAAISVLERAMSSTPAVATTYRNLTAIYEQLASEAYRKALNSSAPSKPLQLVSLDRIDTTPEPGSAQQPTLVASVETFVNESIGINQANTKKTEAADKKQADIILASNQTGNTANAVVAAASTQSSNQTANQAATTTTEPVVPESNSGESVSESSGGTAIAATVSTAQASETVKNNASATAAVKPKVKAEAEAKSKPKAEPKAEPKNSAEKIAAATPSASAKQAVEDAAAEKQAVINHVKSWAAAWSDRNVERYLSHYSDRFKPRSGLSIAEWREQRHGRLRWREFIIVKPTRFSVSVKGDSASVNFSQYYKSDRMEDTIRKTLKLRKENGGWRIIQELI